MENSLLPVMNVHFLCVDLAMIMRGKMEIKLVLNARRDIRGSEVSQICCHKLSLSIPSNLVIICCLLIFQKRSTIYVCLIPFVTISLLYMLPFHHLARDLQCMRR